MSKKPPKYLVLRDNNEQKPWHFPASASCLGTEVVSLYTADYTVKGYENTFLIERKGCVSETAANLVDDAFTRELERLEKVNFPFVVCEFTVTDLVGYPASSGIPKKLWPTLRTNGRFLLKRFCELSLAFKTKWIFAGKTRGSEVAASLMKRLVEHVPAES